MPLDAAFAHSTDKLAWHAPIVAELIGDKAAEARRRFEALEETDPPKRGHGSGIQAGIERRDILIGEVTKWVTMQKAQRADAAMGLETVAAVRGLDRVQHNRNALILAATTYCRDNSRADCLPVLLVLIHGLADCDEGACWCSVPRLAETLGRTPRAIGQAIERGVEQGLLCVEERAGDTHRIWLAAPFDLSEARPATFLEALSQARSPRGRPRKTPEAGLRTIHQENPRSKTSDLLPDNGKTPEVECENPRSHTSDESSLRETANEQEESGSARANAPTWITAEHFSEFRKLSDTFGRSRGAMIVHPTNRADSDPVLAGLVHDELGKFTQDIGVHALSAALRDAGAVALRDVQEGSAGKGRGGMPALTRYLEKVLRTKADDLVRACNVSEAKDRTEKAVQLRIATKRIDGLERGGGSRRTKSRGAAVADDVFEVRS